MILLIARRSDVKRTQRKGDKDEILSEVVENRKAQFIEREVKGDRKREREKGETGKRRN